MAIIILIIKDNTNKVVFISSKQGLSNKIKNFYLDQYINKLIDKNYICLFNYLFISSQMSAKPYFIGSTGILPLW